MNNKDKIKFLVMDVDGTLTDGKVYIGNEGEVFKAFNIKDGCGIHDILLNHNIIPIILTGRESRIVVNRCKEIGIVEMYQGIKDKSSKLNEILEQKSLELANRYCFENVAYIGDDLNDLSAMQLIKAAGGIIGCPADAVSEVIGISDYISTKIGGNGAVREFIEWLVK